MIERRKPMSIPGGGVIVHLLRPEPPEPLASWDEYHLPASHTPSLGTEQALVVGPGVGISRVYVEVLKQQGWEGTEDIPQAFIVDP